MDKSTQFTFHSSKQNPNYISGLVNPSEINAPSFLSLIDDNSKKLIVKTEPKWVRQLVDMETGEVYTSTDLSAAVGRKYKAVNKFCSVYAASFRKRDVSLLLHTFTQVNMCNYTGISPFLASVKYRYQEIDRKLLGYVWTLECSERFHVHYHLVTAINRLDVRKMPVNLKLEGLWGRRTGVEFVKGNVKEYLQKRKMFDYISKNSKLWERYQIRRASEEPEGKLGVMRMYGKSREFSLPDSLMS